MRSATLLAAMLLLTAGCLGMGGDEGSPDQASPASEDTAANASPSANTSTGDHEHQPQPETHWVNITGEVSGVSTGVGGIDHVANETFAVPEPAQRLTVTVAAEDGELNVGLLPPECTNEPEYAGSIETQGPDCEESGTTTNDTSEKLTPNGGTVSFSPTEIEAGNWTVELAKDHAGADAVSYTITAAYVEVHEPGPGHHS